MSKYTEELVLEITDLITKDTFTINEICKIVGISKDTYHRWLRDNSDFSDSIKKARYAQKKNIARVARNSLIRQINGFMFKDIKEDFIVDDEGNEVLKSKTVLTKYSPPNPTLVIFSLKTCNPEEFTEKTEVELKTNTDINIPIISWVESKDDKNKP